MDVLVSLKHDGKLSDYVNKAYAAKHLCDVKVVTGDQSTFYTHRLVLSAFSEFFQRKISGQQESHNMVIPIGEVLFVVGEGREGWVLVGLFSKLYCVTLTSLNVIRGSLQTLLPYGSARQSS